MPGAGLERRAALEVEVHGVVQGVGFRPFVHRLALRHALDGWVRNESGAVRIEIEGPVARLDRFVEELRSEAPPLARIDELVTRVAVPRNPSGFEVLASLTGSLGRQPVSPDVAPCDACIRELLDPADRRYRYPFITCTDCGPRFTVIESMPYDRERTSMRAYRQCAACSEEYVTPSNRRYQSQTNSCPDCGPRVWFELAGAGGTPDPGRGDSARRPSGRGPARAGTDDAIADAARVLLTGGIVAIRGLGGFHLAADATCSAAVARLRARKLREAKPLAVMVSSIDEARHLCSVSREEASLLSSPERPIVLLHSHPHSALAPDVSPGLDTVGLFLSCTPLHLLLLGRVRRPLVMTSGNRSEEPIASGNEEARERLGGIADAFLLHDREIVARYDDSVVRMAGPVRLMIRRARGYAPLPLRLPVPAPEPLFAVGPHLKNTFTLADGGQAWVSQHIGDLDSLESLEHFEAAVERFRTLFRIEPRTVVRDLHPGYLSTRIADSAGLDRTIVVQHHHAHVAAVAAENGVVEPVVGLAFDGTGFGHDGYVWGAETLVADLRGFRRVGQLRYAPLPGGDLAIREPWRVALGYLSLDPSASDAYVRAFAGIVGDVREVAETQVERGLNAPLASSIGRLFDAAAAILGVRRFSRYEGQAAMEMESLAGARPAPPWPFPISLDHGGIRVLDPVPLLRELGLAALRGIPVADLAASFHESVAAAAVTLVAEVCEENAITRVALGGGVFQNVRLLSSVRHRLEERGLLVLLPRELGPNDSAISYGQAAVAAAILRDGIGG